MTVRRYTHGMKVAVSIPDAVFAEAELLAKRLNASRSEIYARALDAYVGNHMPDRVTAALDAMAEATGEGRDDFGRAAAQRVFDRVEW